MNKKMGASCINETFKKKAEVEVPVWKSGSDSFISFYSVQKLPWQGRIEFHSQRWSVGVQQCSLNHRVRVMLD